MSKHETWRTRSFWERTGGLLIEEFVVVSRSQDTAIRKIDGLIVLGQPAGVHALSQFNISGHDVVCVQTKPGRLGMYVMGQAFFSRELLRSHAPRSIRSVIICGKDDVRLRALCDRHELEVVVIP